VEASAVTLGAVSNFNIAPASKRVSWADDYAVSPTRVRTKAGTVLTFKNSSSKPHTIAARDGSWSTGVIPPGASGSATVMKAGTYEYICTEHPWSIGQLIVE
jgi:plastocyanin